MAEMERGVATALKGWLRAYLVVFFSLLQSRRGAGLHVNMIHYGCGGMPVLCLQYAFRKRPTLLYVSSTRRAASTG